jgi:bacteriorhodopsin
MDLVNITVIISIIVQLITGVVAIDGFQYKLNPKDGILKTILGLETGVQFVELLFYIVFAMVSIPLSNLAATRYYDWFLTTPTMLISTMMYFYYLLSKNNKTLIETVTSIDFFNENWAIVTFVVIANFMMLLFGYLYEIKSISLIEGFLWGFVFFGFTFYGIYKQFVLPANDKENEKVIEDKQEEVQTLKDRPSVNTNTNEIYILFTFLFIVWGLYGIVFVLGDEMKNISFNMLDIVSKNFYGLYIYYKIVQMAIV